MKKTYITPELFEVNFLSTDVITISIGLKFGDANDEGSVGKKQSVLGFEEF